MNDTSQQPSARLGANHGYLIDGDVVRLHADVEVLDAPPLVGYWALQLWACEAPHAGGPLSGVKVAETELSGIRAAVERASRLDTEAHARVPGGPRDYAMVLVLASGTGGHYNQVHDFANYPARERFITPHLEGSVGYQIDGEHVVLEANAVRSPRSHDNVSGSLTLELWALADEYGGGTFEGHLLGRTYLGRLAGQHVLPAIAERVTFDVPPAGRWHVVMMLREWVGQAEYVTRDYARFVVPYVVADVSPASADAPAPCAAAQPAQAVTAEASPERTLDAETAVASGAPDTPAEGAPARRSARVSINHSSAAQLAAVKRMSEKLAREIVKGRPYASLEALLDVRGIGPKLLVRLRPYLAI